MSKSSKISRSLSLRQKNTIWEAKLNIANTANGEKVLYDIYPIKKTGRAIKLAATLSNNAISQGNKIVNSFNEDSLEKFSRKKKSTPQAQTNSL